MSTPPPPQSVRRILGTLELLANSATGETLSAIARGVDAPKNSLVTLIAGLAQEGYVTRDERSRYRIGPAGFSLATRMTGGIKLPGLVRPALQRLMEATGETALAGILSPAQDSVIYVEKAESKNPMRYTVPVAEHRELHCTALGKLALAFMKEPRRSSCIAALDLQPSTATTITTRRQLLAAVKRIRATGIATSHDERIVGASAIAAPLLMPDGSFVAGIAVIGPSARIHPRTDAFTRIVVNEAKALTHLIANAPQAFSKS